MGAIERCSKLLQVRGYSLLVCMDAQLHFAPPHCLPTSHGAPQSDTAQHWSSGFESSLSAVLSDNREAEASTSLQLQAVIQTRDRANADLSHQLHELRATNTDLVSQLAVAGESREHASAVAAEHAQRAQAMMADAESRYAALEAKIEEQSKRHEEYAGFIAEVSLDSFTRTAAAFVSSQPALQECSVKDDLIRDLEAERVAHCSALADLRSSTASLASTVEAVTSALAHFAPGKCPQQKICRVISLTLSPDVDQGDALALSHAVAELVTSLRNDNDRSHAQFLRAQVTSSARSSCWCLRAADARASGRAGRCAVQREFCSATHDGRGRRDGGAAQEGGRAAEQA
jgi:hypothetical protein